MDVKQLRFFLAVVEQGSLTRAAQILSVAQSVISHHVSALEKDVGHRLFVRHGRGVVPTDAGTLLAEHARGIVYQLETAHAELEALHGIPVGRVAIGLGARLGRILSAPMLIEFRNSYPDIRLDFNEMPALNIVEWLSMGRLDLGLLYPPPDFDAYPTRKIADVDLCLVSRNEAPHEHYPVTIAFQDLAGVPLILQEGQSNILAGGLSLSAGSTRLLLEHTAKKEKVELNIVGELGEASGVPILLDLVKGGQGSTILPFHLVHGENALASGELKTQFITSPSLCCPLSILFPRHRPTTRAAHVVADAIQHHLTEQLTKMLHERNMR